MFLGLNLSVEGASSHCGSAAWGQPSRVVTQTKGMTCFVALCCLVPLPRQNRLLEASAEGRRFWLLIGCCWGLILVRRGLPATTVLQLAPRGSAQQGGDSDQRRGLFCCLMLLGTFTPQNCLLEASAEGRRFRLLIGCSWGLILVRRGLPATMVVQLGVSPAGW